MSLFDKLFRRPNKELEQRYAEIKDQILEKAKEQSFEHKIDYASEAKKLGEQCNIYVKKTFHEYADIAILLLANYPPELAFYIIAGFAQFANQLGYIPIGKIMIAIQQIGTLRQKLPVSGMRVGFMLRTDWLTKYPELTESIIDREKRVEKAVRLLAISVLSLSNIQRARKTFFDSIINLEIRELVKEELYSIDRDVAQFISS